LGEKTNNCAVKNGAEIILHPGKVISLENPMEP